MSFAKAVITSARATLADYFMAGKHGLIIPPENATELKEAIMSLWNDPSRAKTMGEAGRENVKTRFTMEIFSRKLAEIFYEVAEKL